MNAQEIAARLKELRMHRNLSISDTAAKLSIPRPRYCAYEEGRASPPLPVLFALRDLYCFNSVDELLGRYQPPNTLNSAFQIAPENVKRAIELLLESN